MPSFLSGKFTAVVLLVSFLFNLFLLKDNFSVKDFAWSLQNVGQERSKLSYDIVVGVLSARRHFELRQALRETWIGYVENNKELSEKVLVKFIIGNKACHVPVQDRLDQYTCETNRLVQPVLNQDIIAYKVPNGTSGNHIHPGPLGMDFKVNFPIVITQLGVFDSNSDGLNHGLLVRLYDRVSGDEVVNATFTPSSPGKRIGGSRFKPIDEYILPKGFEASIVAENFSESDPSNNKPMAHGTTDSGGGLITFIRVSRFGMVQGSFPDNEESTLEEPNQYAAGSFIYHAFASNTGEFSEERQNKKDEEAKKRESDLEKLLLKEETELQKEIKEHGDVLLVDAVEVYRNLPKKMLHFYKWVADNFEFNFTLKTDDDCFVNIESILKDLLKYKLHEKTKIWWSGFRFDWPVERFGKWREPDYSAPVYPAFACGAGNMLSADLVGWLARNADTLKEYQGEDVSLGIWLSSVGPTLVKDYRWACSQDCNKDMYTSPENSPEELRELWTNLEQCGDLCGCT